MRYFLLFEELITILNVDIMENPFTKPQPITLTKNTVEITDSLKVPYNVMEMVTEVSTQLLC